jgi:replicative DNA helicase
MEDEGLEAADPAEVAREESAEKLQRKRLGAILPGAVEQLRRRATGEDRPILLPNWPNFAATMGGGLWPGLHVLTAGTGTGKSQFALQLALQAAKGGVPTLYMGLELDDLGLVARLLCMAAGDGAGIWWSSLYTGNGGGTQRDATLRRLADAYSAELSSLPLYLDTDQGPHGWAYNKIAPAVKQLRAAHPEADGQPVLLVIDFLQLLASPEEGAREDMKERISKAAYQARDAARKENVAILALSSTARTNYGTLGGLVLNGEGKPKTLPIELVGMGKESGDIEFAVDSALVMARATGELGEDGNVYGADPGAVWIAAAKLRAGSGKWCRLVESNGWFSEGASQSGAPNLGKPKKTRATPAAPKGNVQGNASEPSGSKYG